MNHLELIEQCNQIEEWFTEVNHLFGTDFEADKKGRREVTEYISLLLSCDSFETVWLQEDGYQKAGVRYQESVKLLEQLKEAQIGLCELMLPNCQIADHGAVAEKMFDDAQASQDIFLKFLEIYRQTMMKGLSAEELERNEARDKALNSLKEESEILHYTIDLLEESKTLISTQMELNEKGLICLEEFVTLMSLPDPVLPNWITEYKYQTLARFFMREKQLAEQIISTEAELSQDWTSDVYELDARLLAERFRKDYVSPLKRMGKQYRQDKDIIMDCNLHPGRELLNEEILDLLETLLHYQAAMKEFARNKEEAVKEFGSFYLGLQTDWEYLEHLLANAKRYNDFYKTYGLPAESIALLSSSCQERRQFSIRSMTVEFMMDNHILSSLQQVTTPYRGRSYIRCYKAIRLQKAAMEDYIAALKELSNKVLSDLSAFTGENCTFEVLPDTSLLQEFIRRYGYCCDLTADFRKNESGLRDSFPSMYQGINSEWEKILFSWKHGKRICEFAEEHPLPEETCSLLKLPLSERQNLMIKDRSLMDLGFGNGRRDYVDFFASYPQNVRITRDEA